MCQNRIEIRNADITTLRVDAIVNAANRFLRGGAGVDGAIHDAAGDELLKECEKYDECPPGEARITRGYRLAANYVIHAVGPIWHGGAENEAELLAQCYRNSFLLARQHNVRTIAFPAISTGIYGYPWRPAAEIALREAMKWLAHDPDMEKVIFACFGSSMTEIYSDVLSHLETI